ncbi:hypothetical protein COLO4_08604, partial [Corchorus olitorius]
VASRVESNSGPHLGQYKYLLLSSSFKLLLPTKTLAALPNYQCCRSLHPPPWPPLPQAFVAVHVSSFSSYSMPSSSSFSSSYYSADSSLSLQRRHYLPPLRWTSAKSFSLETPRKILFFS